MEKFMKKSKVITFIGGFYIFGGIISFLSLLLGGSPLNTVFALPDIPDYVVKFLLAIIYIPAGYLFLKRVKFSNWLILVLAVLTFCISAELTTTFNAQPYIGNMLYSLFVIIVTIIRRKEFTNNINFTIYKKQNMLFSAIWFTKNAGRRASRPPRPVLSHGLFSTHLEACSSGDWIICPACPPTTPGKPCYGWLFTVLNA